MKSFVFLAKIKKDPFEEVYVNRFIEVLCNRVKDYILLTDFFFEVCISFNMEAEAPEAI